VIEQYSSGGLLPSALTDEKWEKRAEAPHHYGMDDSKLVVYARRCGSCEALCTPELTVAGAVMALVVKVDVEAFDASVHTSDGLEYGRATMEETACAWADCQNRFSWVPDRTKGAMLFRGPHVSTPNGTKVRVTANGAFRAYIILEVEYKGGQARTGGWKEALPALGWVPEAGSPSWGDNASSMKVLSRMACEGEEIILPPTNGQVVFSIAVVDIARGGGDRLAEEMKRAFRAWDKDGKGGLSRGDMRNLLCTLCPDMQAQGCDALLDSMDKTGSGLFGYEEFIEKVLLGG